LFQNIRCAKAAIRIEGPLMHDNYLRQKLTHYFHTTRSKNPSYSLRAMARSFKTSPAHLSQVLSGKRPMTDKFALKVSNKLDLSPLEMKMALAELSSSDETSLPFDLIEDEKFKLVSDWHHFAILSLSQVPDSKANVRWISQRLGIDYHVAKAAFERLRKLGMIKVENGSYHQVPKALHTTNDVPSSAIRKYHKQNLELAAGKLDEVDVNLREFSAITVATSLKKLPLAKKLIRKFKADIYELLNVGKKEEVYTLSIQLFPVSKLNQLKYFR